MTNDFLFLKTLSVTEEGSLLRKIHTKDFELTTFFDTFKSKGTVCKPRRQVRGEGVAQMSTVLNKSYMVKVSTKGGGGVKNAPNSVYMVCTQPLQVPR